MKTELRCLLCGKVFVPTCHITRQKYCSVACRLKYNNAKRYFGGKVNSCPECGSYVEQTGDLGRWRRFCSDRCRVVYHGKEEQERRKNRERPKQICPNCGIEFRIEWGKGKVRRFCSDSCRIEWWKEYHKANAVDSHPERNCICCGRKFNRSRWGGGEYCSRDCYLKSMSQAHEQVVCEWCGEEFSALISTNRKYCSFDCSVAARHKVTHKKAGHRIHYHDADDWRSKVEDAARNAEKSYKRGRRVWLVCGVTSMYIGLDGLLGIIRYKLRHNPFDGAIYVFCDSTNELLKYLHWDGAGFDIGKRRAQSGSYPWPPSEAGDVIEITEEEFEFLKVKSIVPFRTKNGRKITT